MTAELHGTGAAPLSGVGTAVWHDAGVELPDTPDPGDVDPETERRAFETARERVRERIETERDRTVERVGESEAAILDAHLQFLSDPRIVGGVEDAIEEGLPAPHAVDRAYEDAAGELAAVGGRTAERADDLRELRDRLVAALTGADRADPEALADDAVVLAERLGPGDTAGFDPERIAGIATVTGGRNSHAAIVARSLEIPAVVGVGEELRSVEEGTAVAVDGTTGTVVVDPEETTRERLAGEADLATIDRRVETADGRPVEVGANLGGLDELGRAAERGSDGVGLLRTEFLFVDRRRPPDEDEQYDAYAETLAAFPDDRVVVRTLDVGGDKPLPYLDQPEETDPFLGVRGIRRSLERDADLFERQLRALLRAAAADGGDLAVMFPMVAAVEELAAALDRVEAVADELDDEGVPHAIPELGVMVETPSSALVADALADRVSFLSIGTNDLTQYVMAASRENEAVADLHAPTHPGVLRAIDRAVTAGHDGRAWVGMCGEMAGVPRYAELLIGLGLDELSMSPVTVPRVKAAVEATDAGAAERLADRALAAGSRAEVEALLDDATTQERE